jgi:hypothetical protein
MARDENSRTERELMLARKGSLGLALLALLCACAATEGTEDQAAVIVSPNAVSRAALQQAVSSMLGKSVLLSDDALTKESTLIIERAAARDPSGRKIEARGAPEPDVLRLVKRDGACVLIHESSKNVTVLQGVTCGEHKPK